MWAPFRIFEIVFGVPLAYFTCQYFVNLYTCLFCVLLYLFSSLVKAHSPFFQKLPMSVVIVHDGMESFGYLIDFVLIWLTYHSDQILQWK